MVTPADSNPLDTLIINKWGPWKNLGRTRSIPRTAIITKNRKTAFLINDKLFGTKDLAMIRNLVKEANQSRGQE